MILTSLSLSVSYQANGVMQVVKPCKETQSTEDKMRTGRVVTVPQLPLTSASPSKAHSPLKLNSMQDRVQPVKPTAQFQDFWQTTDTQCLQLGTDLDFTAGIPTITLLSPLNSPSLFDSMKLWVDDVEVGLSSFQVCLTVTLLLVQNIKHHQVYPPHKWMPAEN